MANPKKVNTLLADKSGDGLLSDRQALVADATASPVTLTYSANDPGTTANGAVTFADGTALVAATMYEFADEVEAALTAHSTKINAILDILEAHGLMADS